MNSEIVLNNILCFISTARNSKSTEYILQCCLLFYSIDEVKSAKNLLSEYGNEKVINRRGENALKNEITDIIELFKKFEEKI